MRVYELAKELGVQSKDLLAILKQGGFNAASHMAVLSSEAQAYLAKHMKAGAKPSQTEKAPSTVNTVAKVEQTKKAVAPEKIVLEKFETPHKPHSQATAPLPKKEYKSVLPEKSVVPEKVEELTETEIEDLEAQELREQARVKHLLQATGFAGLAGGPQPGVRRRRRRRSRPVAQAPVIKAPVTEATITKDMLLFEVADLFGKQSGELILSLLKKGMICNRNHLLNVDIIRELGPLFGITVTLKKATPDAVTKKTADTRGATRWPVVVVMGHVDHGKTTLLDYIRKMNVAATEKGGITQHIRAWEVDSTHGKIIFLDTPGHEAFSYLRKRGSKITDVVVLVVAVDDGIKPQTIEAIKHAKDAEVPIIVAVNKIDKMSSAAALETVKRQLAQYELMPEEWGGQTIIVPLSAKTGQGVETLLEMIVLQSQLMDLKADTDVPAQAFVLESHVEKGFGPVATVVVKQGILKQGDYFTSGSSTGKVRILINSHGQKIAQAGPSTPVQVVGFDNVIGLSDWLNVVSQHDYSKARFSKSEDSVAPAQRSQAMSFQPTKEKKKFINLIIKTDTRGSKEAVMDSIDKLIKQHKDIKCPINIITSSIGDVAESDIELAQNTEAMILGLHIRVEKNAQLLAKSLDVDIQNYQIIYELIDAVQALLLSKKEAVFTWNKVGEAVVKKVFDIKGTGIIAGCYMRDGVMSRNNKVTCIRSGKQIGEAKITSLQRDRKPVKEIHAGYECGFTAEGFNEWQEGDTVLCYAETKAE